MCTRFVYRGDNIITGFNFDIDIVEWNHKVINTKDCFYIGIMRPDGMRHSYHGVNRNGNVGTLLYVHGNLSGTYQDSKDCITIADLVEKFIQAEVSFDDVLQILKERKIVYAADATMQAMLSDKHGRTLVVEPGIGWREDEGRYSLITNYSILAPESTRPFVMPEDDRYEKASKMLNIYGNHFTVTIAACMSFIIPTVAFQQQWPENTLRRLFFNVDDEHISAAQEMIDAYTKTVDTSLPVTSRKTIAEQYEAETRASAVMGNTISVIIALVGVLNFINSMVTAIVSRKKEFAMIQSVGMTKRQLRKMLICEGLDYAAITLIVSYIVSTLAVGIGVRAMTANEFSTFHFTLMPLMICTPILLAFAVLIPFLCFKNLEKQSIVERLRTE